MADDRPVYTLTLRAEPDHLDDGTVLIPVRPRVYSVLGLPSGYTAGMFQKDGHWTEVLFDCRRSEMWGTLQTTDEAVLALKRTLP